jgi:hypothetical protein
MDGPTLADLWDHDLKDAVERWGADLKGAVQ